jgi:hypothetical protein
MTMIARLCTIATIALLLSYAHHASAQPVGGTVFCNAEAVYNASTSGSTLLVPAGSGMIYVCG